MTILEVAPREDLTRFCQKWRVLDLYVFGSALRADFSPESDVDVLVSFEDGSVWSLFDHVQMEQELAALLGRKVDLVTRRALDQTQNELLRDEILRTAQIVFSRGEDADAKR
ncbi:MAG: nucleotidyltransferase domain-containing protein [Chloroflexota bacterium]